MSEIPIEDCIEEAILERIEGTNFNTSEEYVNFVLREVLESDNDISGSKNNQEQDLKSQLENLGYL